jgi:uncharacterized membrane protein YfcA
MNLPKILLFSALLLLNTAFVVAWVRAGMRRSLRERPTPVDILIGFGTDFFDALGIGSFAPTTAIYKLRGQPRDDLIPGTLNVGHNAAAFVEVVIFVTAVAVDPLLLAMMVGSAACGAWLGAGIVMRLPRRAIQFFMGISLMIAAIIFAISNLGVMPAGGVARGLAGWEFAFAVAGNFVFGALMSVGIGLYAPCMIMLALLGLHPLAAFPIMMGSCGLVQPAASLRFLNSGRFAWGPAIGLTIGGVAGVLIAVFVVKQLPLSALRWLVTAVALYASILMLRSTRIAQPLEASPSAACRGPSQGS